MERQDYSGLQQAFNRGRSTWPKTCCDMSAGTDCSGMQDCLPIAGRTADGTILFASRSARFNGWRKPSAPIGPSWWKPLSVVVLQLRPINRRLADVANATKRCQGKRLGLDPKSADARVFSCAFRPFGFSAIAFLFGSHRVSFCLCPFPGGGIGRDLRGARAGGSGNTN